MFVVLLACLPAAWLWMLSSQMKEFSESLIGVATFTANILFWRISGYFESETALKPLIHFWSLCVEEQYYILFPIFLMVAWRAGRAWAAALVAGAALASFGIGQWGSTHAEPAAFYLLPARGWEILAGALLALGYAKLDWLKRNTLVNEGASAAGLVLVGYCVFAFDKRTPTPGIYTAVPVLGTVLLLQFATAGTLVGRMLGTKAFAGIGLVSYSAYLWHQPLFAFARLRSPGVPGEGLHLVLAATAFVLAYFSWKYVETPFRRRGNFTRQQIVAYGASGLVAFAVFGLAGMLTAGFTFRFNEGDRYLAELQSSVAGDYVKKRFEALSLKEFDDSDPRKKILILGDSYAQDLVNALYETEFAKRVQVSTHQIGNGCGNLFLPQTGAIRNGCDGKGLYDNPMVRNLMLRADEIWLASNWPARQVESIDQIVRGAREFSGNPVRVFGRKQFGPYTLNRLLALDQDQRIALRNRVDDEALRTNEAMRSRLGAGTFIDVEALLCGDDLPLCRLFTEAGDLISFDGAHLTKAGAVYYGQRLATQPELRDFQDRDSACLASAGLHRHPNPIHRRPRWLQSLERARLRSIRVHWKSPPAPRRACAAWRKASNAWTSRLGNCGRRTPPSTRRPAPSSTRAWRACTTGWTTTGGR